VIDLMYIHDGSGNFDKITEEVPWASEIVSDDFLGGIQLAAKSSTTTHFWYLHGNSITIPDLGNVIRNYAINRNETNTIINSRTIGFGIAHRDYGISKDHYLNLFNDIIRIPTSTLFDVMYICTDEDHSYRNISRLIDLGYDDFKIVRNAGTIYQSHKKASELSSTDWFWVIDGDCYLLNKLPSEDLVDIDMFRPSTIFWKAENPLGITPYGHGAIKLMHKSLFPASSCGDENVDITTSLGHNIFMDKITNIHAFDTSEYSIYKTAIREMSKLYVKKDEDSMERLRQWTDAIITTRFGKDLTSLLTSDLINDFEHIRKKYENL